MILKIFLYLLSTIILWIRIMLVYVTILNQLLTDMCPPTFPKASPPHHGRVLILNKCVRKSRGFSLVLSTLGSPLTGSVTKPTKETPSKKSGQQDGHILMAFWTLAPLIITLKPFWRYMRSQRQDSFGMAALKEDGRLFSDGTKKTDILSRQFASVFTRGSVGNQARLYGPNYPAIEPMTIDQCRVEKQLQGLNVGKASGPNNQPCRLLRVLAHELAPILTCIYKQSIETRPLPSKWTKAFVALVFQKSARCMPENYHPVSLTCVSCKILEPIICKIFLWNSITSHAPRSTASQGLQNSDWCRNFGLLVPHDTVPREHLLGKLRFLGIQGPLLDWTAAFLKTREQTVVVVDGRSSHVKWMGHEVQRFEVPYYAGS